MATRWKGCACITPIPPTTPISPITPIPPITPLPLVSPSRYSAVLENLLRYRLRLSLLNRAAVRALVTMAGANRLCLLALPGLLAFAAAGLAVEWLALALLRREQRVSIPPPRGRAARRARGGGRAGVMQEVCSFPLVPVRALLGVGLLVG